MFHGDDDVVVHSGDFGWVDDDGDLYIQGRRDRMVKRLGYRVSPDEVVEAVLASGLVQDACVTITSPLGDPDADSSPTSCCRRGGVDDLERVLANGAAPPPAAGSAGRARAPADHPQRQARPAALEKSTSHR